MTRLIVVTCDDLRGGEYVMDTMTRLQEAHRLDLVGGAIIQVDVDGTLKVHQAVDAAAGGSGGAHTWFLLLRALLKEMAGADVRSTSLAAPDALRQIGLDERLIHELAEALNPGTSALVGLVGDRAPDTLLDELGSHGGHVLRPAIAARSESGASSGHIERAQGG